MTDPVSTPPDHPLIAQTRADLAGGKITRRGFLTRATALGLAPGVALHLAGTGQPARAATPARGGHLRIEMPLLPLGDPRLFDWSQKANVTRGWLEYLVRYGRDGSFSGQLLDRWEVNADASAYVLHLRPGVIWHDGRDFDADDVAFNFARWCDARVEGNSMAARLSALIDPATGQLRDGAVRVEDPLTLRLSLASPDVTLIASLSDYPAAVLPRGYDGQDPTTVMGTGPYEIVSYTPGVRAELRRKPDFAWWGTGAWAERITFVDFGPDPRTALAAFETGEIDLNYESTGRFIADFDALDLTRSEAVTATTAVVRARHDTAPYDTPALRRALQLAVDNGVVLELGIGGRGTRGDNDHVCPIQPDHAPLPPALPDLAAAQALLAESGASDHVHRLVAPDDVWLRNSAEAVAAQLADAGITTQVQVISSRDYWAAWKDHTFSITQWNHRPLGVQTLAIAYRSGSAWNETGFSDPEFDAALDVALSLADAQARRDTMAVLQQILRDQGVMIQPYWRALYRHARPGIHGADMHPTYELHLDQIWIDPAAP